MTRNQTTPFDPVVHRRAQALFESMIDLPGEELAERLEQLRSESPELHHLVEELLAEDHSSQLFGDTNEGFLGMARDSTGPQLPLQIGGFELLGELGRGGMGVVYEAQQEVPRRKVALKALAMTRGSNAAIERFRAEIQLMVEVKHPGIPQVYEVFEHGGRPIVAMELVDGVALDTATAALDLEQRLEMLEEIADIVSAAHERGIVHRDLKPSNILVDRAGRPKVLDFGLAAARGETAVAGGTLAYAAPEQLQEVRVVDVRTDVYSLGVIAWELLTGQRPHPGTTDLGRALAAKTKPPRGGDSLPRGLDAVLRKALAPSPVARYASAAGFGQDLRRARTHYPVRALAGDRRHWLGSHLRRRGPALLGLGAVLGLGFGAAMLIQPEGDPAGEVASCPHIELAFEQVWNPGVRDQLAASLAEDPSMTPLFGAQVLASLDDYTASWFEAAQANCEASVAGQRAGAAAALRWSVERERCLDLRLASVDALLDELLSPGGERLAATELGKALDSLPSLAGCTDAAARDPEQPTPEDPELAEGVHELRVELARFDTLRTLEAYAEIEQGVEALRERVDALDYPPLDAELGIRAAYAARGLDRAAEAEGLFFEAFLAAASSEHAQAMRWAGVGRADTMIELDFEPARSGEWMRVVEALHEDSASEPEWARLHCAMVDLHTARARFDDALQRARLCYESHVRTQGERGVVVAQALSRLARAEWSVGASAEALEHATRGLEILEAAGIERSLTSLRLLGTSITALDDLGDAERKLEIADRLDSMARALLEPNDTRLADQLALLGQIRTYAGMYDEARANYEQALAIHLEVFGADHSRVAVDRFHLARLLCTVEDYEGGLEMSGRGLAELAPDASPDFRSFGLQARSTCNLRQGRYEAALTDAVAAREVLRGLVDEDSLRFVDLSLPVAEAQVFAGHYEDARALYVELLAQVERQGAGAGQIVNVRRRLAECLLALERVEEALEVLAGAPPLLDPSWPGLQVDFSFTWAKAQLAAGDHERARVLAQRALGEGADERQTAMIEDWIDELPDSL